MVISSEKQQVVPDKFRPPAEDINRKKLVITCLFFEQLVRQRPGIKNQISLLCVFTAWRYAGILRRC
ncbi:hypothetical protein B9081_024385 [Citrobacter werkmanii]|nr:hypothetical protein B9081_024385 [Citrobacter werkmanii]